MSIYKKLNDARARFSSLELKKSGHNKFAGYYYFELGDFIIPAIEICKDIGLCPVVSFEDQTAVMRVFDTDSEQAIKITSPLGSASLKGCHEVQNIGAVQTYQRRYLWMALFEIVEHDALDCLDADSVEPEKPWYNDFEQHKEMMLAKIKSGESTPKQIIASLVVNFKVNKQVRAAIEELGK